MADALRRERVREDAMRRMRPIPAVARRAALGHNAGEVDVQVVAALSEYDPQRKGFLVTFKIEEGQPYRVGSIG